MSDVCQGGQLLLEFSVAGIPGPQGSKNAFRSGSRINVVESSAKVKPWRASVAAAARAAVGPNQPGFDGPIVADMIFSLPRPKRAEGKPWVLPAVVPDLSKLVRATEDALDTDSGVLVNDSRIIGYQRQVKFYVDDPDQDALSYPGAVIRLYAANVSAGR